ncbi:HupE/UreJ family protein [Flavobacteriaceae bacterium TP-CH-4]|uniref:HupE/UreJ family protein n=1 Tax=Pelagihabitans pacificus TaxID=2696054 RepID=A0A967E7P0_9FLAO|nr:HupE/UreJ family protein [Pelagihabitans pacificus]NHF60454.1 HupE/UreJ family protein [Pelagihabitans pacificus]
MPDFLFYVKLGLDHVLDFNAYDHILFLTALALPFTFEQWKPVVVLATVFTVAHCLSLALSVYNVVVMDVGWIEFLIPVTILLTAVFNLFYLKAKKEHKSLLLHGIATAFFGLIHGFGFSNYFKMLMAEETDKLTPLIGFATGIEVSQVLIVLTVLVLAYVIQSIIKVKQPVFVVAASIFIIFLTIPMLIETYPL